MPNGDKDYNDWKVGQANFQGFVKAKLEGLEKSMGSICNETKSQDTRLGKLENRQTATEVKGGIFGFLGGLIGGFIAIFAR